MTFLDSHEHKFGNSGPHGTQKMGADLATLHPFAVSFVGHSGSGKTTLLEKLMQVWSNNGLHIGYIKHDAHGFEMDKQGKDTWRLGNAGAGIVVINDKEKSAVLASGSNIQRYSGALQECDFLVVEGFKSSHFPKFILLDEQQNILQDPSISTTQNICGLVGPWEASPLQSDSPFYKVPYFNRNNVEEIRCAVEKYFREIQQTQQVYGLILAGGKSQRMGHNKALIRYHSEKTQLQVCYDLLQPFCQKVFVSARTEQINLLEEYQNFEIISDTFLNFGPLGGLLSAQRMHANTAFLAIAVDMPGLKHDTLSTLMQNRKPFLHATAFASRSGNFAEPLCTIYEAKSFQAMLHLIGCGIQCPAKMLNKMHVEILPQQFADNPLANINTPQELNTFKETRGAFI